MQLAGWLPDEMAGKLFDEFIHPEDRPAAERAGAGILRGEAGTFDARLRTATGGYRWVAFTVSPVRDDAGTVVARVAGWRDVDGERRAREALEASEARYRLLVDNAMDIVIQTVEGAVQWVSPSVARVLGWGQDEMIGRRTADLWHPDDRAAAAETRDAVYAGRSSVSVYRLRRKEGTYAWIESTMQPYTERDGRAGSVGIMRDVTDRVQAVQARAESEERYRLLAENASDMVFRGGPDGVLEWVSPSVRTMLGYLPEDLVGKATAELMHPDDAAAMRAAGAQTDDDMPVSYRARMRRSDGAFTWVEVITRPVRGHSGAIIGRVGGVRDIGSQVEAQARLEESEARYHLLAENASDVVYLARPDGAIEWVSASVAGALGLRPEDLVGTRMLDLVHPDDRIAIGRVRPTALAGAAVAAPVDGFLMRIRTGSGDYRWVSWRTTQVFDDEGEPAGIVNGLSFVDELVRARERAEADEAKLQATLDSLLDPHVMLLAVRGADGTIIDFLYDDANDAACAYNGMPRDHLVGRRLLELMPGQVGAGLLAMYAAAIGSGVPLVLDDFAYPSEFRQAERRYDIRAVAVGDSLSYTWRDVTERFEFSRSMAESEERYRLLADNSSDVVVHTRDGVIAWISPSVHESLGGSPDDWTGVRLIDAIHPDDVAAYAQGSALVDVGESPIGRMRVRGRDGTYRWIATHACRYLDAAGRPDGHISAFRLVDDLVSAEGELIHQARFDALTGLLKREGALSQLTDTGQQQRVAGVERAVLFCDLDDFKAVNDERGHGSGDEFLRITAARIVGAVRAGDTVARMGGDEFLVILDGVHDVEEACAIAEKIRRAAAEPVVLLAGVVTGTLSIGVTLNVPGESADSIVSRADVAMYDAKHRGRNRVVALTAPDAPI
jgi:diguanylate cyclase (GGDEF)-like protein/PAS domain S-box-containing protein